MLITSMTSKLSPTQTVSPHADTSEFSQGFENTITSYFCNRIDTIALRIMVRTLVKAESLL
jgi:hypothetical protein